MLAYGPIGNTKKGRERHQSTKCLRCGAEGPAVERVDGLFSAARDAWNRRSSPGVLEAIDAAFAAGFDRIVLHRQDYEALRSSPGGVDLEALEDAIEAEIRTREF